MKRIATIAAALFLLAAPAGASHPERVDPADELLRVTARLKQVAHRLNTRAERRSDHLDRSGQRALRAVAFLAQGTARYHRKVEEGDLRPHKLRRRYQKLDQAFHQARHCFSELDPGPRMARDLDRIERLMHRLDDRIVAVVAARDGRRHGNDRLAYRDRIQRRDHRDRIERRYDRQVRRDRIERRRDRQARRDRILSRGWGWAFGLP